MCCMLCSAVILLKLLNKGHLRHPPAMLPGYDHQRCHSLDVQQPHIHAELSGSCSLLNFKLDDSHNSFADYASTDLSNANWTNTRVLVKSN